MMNKNNTEVEVPFDGENVKNQQKIKIKAYPVTKTLNVHVSTTSVHPFTSFSSTNISSFWPSLGPLSIQR